MYNKVKIRQHHSTGTFTSANSFAVGASLNILVVSRRDTEVEVYTTSDGGSNWTLLETISEDDRSSSISLPASTTHVNFISNKRGKVAVYDTNQTLTPIQGDALSSSQQNALDTRLSSVESKVFTHRNKISLSADGSRLSGQTVALGSDASLLASKQKIVFLNGLALHADDYTLDDSGNIIFAFDLVNSATINIVAWE